MKMRTKFLVIAQGSKKMGRKIKKMPFWKNSKETIVSDPRLATPSFLLNQTGILGSPGALQKIP